MLLAMARCRALLSTWSNVSVSAIFLAPEGFIADPGSAIGEAYLDDCDAFMRKMLST